MRALFIGYTVGWYQSQYTQICESISRRVAYWVSWSSCHIHCSHWQWGSFFLLSLEPHSLPRTVSACGAWSHTLLFLLESQPCLPPRILLSVLLLELSFFAGLTLLTSQAEPSCSPPLGTLMPPPQAVSQATFCKTLPFALKVEPHCPSCGNFSSVLLERTHPSFLRVLEGHHLRTSLSASFALWIEHLSILPLTLHFHYPRTWMSSCSLHRQNSHFSMAFL